MSLISNRTIAIANVASHECCATKVVTTPKPSTTTCCVGDKIGANSSLQKVMGLQYLSLSLNTSTIHSEQGIVPSNSDLNEVQ